MRIDFARARVRLVPGLFLVLEGRGVGSLLGPGPHDQAQFSQVSQYSLSSMDDRVRRFEPPHSAMS